MESNPFLGATLLQIDVCGRLHRVADNQKRYRLRAGPSEQFVGLLDLVSHQPLPTSYY
jgi:hypothetical protein